MLAEAHAIVSALPAQLTLPSPTGDLAMLRLVPPPPASQVLAIRQDVAHRPRRHRSLSQLWLWTPPPDLNAKPKIGGVVVSLAEALAEYRRKRKKELRRQRRALGGPTTPGTTAPPRARPRRPRAARAEAVPTKPVVVVEALVAPLCDVTGWSWSVVDDAARLVDGGAGAEGWAAWRGSVLEDAMARRAAVVRAELEAKGAPTGPRQVRTKQQAQAAATAVLMKGKPGTGAKKKAVATGAAEGAKA